MHALRPPVLIGPQQHLGIGIALELQAVELELAADLAEVVDLAIEGEREAGGLVAHRLVRAVRIDDREAPVAEGHAVFAARGEERAAAGAVGATVRERIEHWDERALIRRMPTRGDPTGDTAHDLGGRLGSAHGAESPVELREIARHTLERVSRRDARAAG